ncbi:MAG: Ig-like domain-containing protein [Arenicellales bacterium WSBS_2016_MAG_OTU3]
MDRDLCRTTADTTPPTVAFSEVPANHDGSSEFTVTVTLSETATDFVEGDIVFSSNASGMLSGSGTSYELTVTPTDTNSITIDIMSGYSPTPPPTPTRPRKH